MRIAKLAMPIIGVCFLCIAEPVRSTIGGRNILLQDESWGEGLPSGYTEHTALRVVDYKYNITPIDSGILCPMEGDFWVELDFVWRDGTGQYIAPAGLRPITANSCSIRTYSTNRIIFNYGSSDGATFTRYPSGVNFYTSPFSCGFGMIGDMDVMSVNGQVYSQSPKGGERGNGASTFRFVGAANVWDNILGTLVGKCRIYIDGEVVWDGIPCSRDSDGMPGFFDVVGKKFCAGTRGIEVWDMAE